MQQQQQQQRVKVVAGYALQQRLGSGSFATVYKGIKISAAAPTEQQQQQQQQQQQRESSSSSMCDDDENDTTTTATTDVAIKAISRTSEKLTKKVLQNLEIEISILRTYRHPNIVCMHDVTKTQQHFYLILEYCDGGDVQHLIRSRKSGRLSEKLARRLMRDLSSGLRFLWRQQLIHRDIKPQNLLLTGRLPMEEIIDNPPSAATIQKDQNNPPNNNNNNYGFSLKIADFGFARHLQTASLAETLCGSPLYMAPEILQHHRYDAKADLWSVGTVLFEMIAGCPPFNGENHIDLLRNIQRKAVRLPPDVRISKACVNLLRILLNRNP
ncbi:Pkinase-domain-containing protein, partial [Fragilariopsis cylindrus CCMP1102]